MTDNYLALTVFFASGALLFTSCSESSASVDAGGMQTTEDAALLDASPTDVDAGADAGPLEACLPPAGGAATFGPTHDLSHTATPVAIGDVGEFAVTPDSSTVVFIADTEDLGMMRLYATPIAGGPITRLSHNAAWLPGQDVRDFAITSDGQRVVFWGNVDEPNAERLYSVAITGGSVQTLTDGVLMPRTIKIAPNDEYVVFIARPAAPFDSEALHSVPIMGGTIQTLSHPGDSSQGVREYRITPDSTRVLFYGDTEVPNSRRGHSVAITGGTIANFLPISADASTAISDFILSPDGLEVVFSSRLIAGGPARYYRAPVAGGASSVLFEDVGGVPLEWISDAAFSGAGHLFFEGAFFDINAGHYFSLSLSSGTTEWLTEGITTHQWNFEPPISPNGQYAAFSATAPDDNKRIYSVPLAGGPLTTLSQNIFEEPETFVGFPIVTSDSSRVVYTGVAEGDEVSRVYAVCIEGGTQMTLSPNVGPDQNLHPTGSNVALTSDGRFAMFRGPLLVDGVVQLFVADMLTSQVQVLDEIQGDSSLGVNEGKFSPDDRWVVFSGDIESDEVVRLYSREVIVQ